MYFGLSSWLLALVLVTILFGATLLGWLRDVLSVNIGKPSASRSG
jgi:hypothetical protein